MHLGQWATELDQLLDSDCWGPTRTVNAALLNNLLELALDNTTKGKTRDNKMRQMHDMPWWQKLEETVSTYLSHYFTFIILKGVYIMQTLAQDASYESFQAFKSGQIAVIIKSYKWAFDIFDSSPYKHEYATKARFCGEPFDADVADNEYNLCKNAMPLLHETPTRPTQPEVERSNPSWTTSMPAYARAAMMTLTCLWVGWPTWPNSRIARPAGCPCLSATRGLEWGSSWATCWSRSSTSWQCIALTSVR